MGACYSKNVTDSKLDHPNRAPKQHRIDSKKNKRNLEGSPSEILPLKEHDSLISKDQFVRAHRSPKKPCKYTTVVNNEVSVSSTPDFAPGHLEEKSTERGVVPSDSGIESITTLQEDTRENVHFTAEEDRLTQKLQRLSRGSCHKCGNFKLDDTDLTVLLADTYCSCGPRHVGRPSVNPPCQTHGVHKNKRNSSPVECTTYGFDGTLHHRPNTGNDKDINENDERDSSVCGTPHKSSLRSSNSAKIDKNLRISTRSSDTLDMALVLLSSTERSRCKHSNEESESSKVAPLAQFDLADTFLNDSTDDRTQKRRSLLSEILDITDSICKCDFYSNEFCCTRDHHPTRTAATHSLNTSEVSRLSTEETHCEAAEAPESQLLAGNTKVSLTTSNHDHNSSTSSRTRDIVQGDFHDSRFQIINSSKKSAILLKNVSFAPCSDTKCDSPIKLSSTSYTPSKAGLGSGLGYQNVYECSMSEASSGVSEACQITTQKETHKSSASLGSPGVFVSDSSSDAADDRTEEDLTSLDLDSLSRGTSLSYSSIRQLVESTEELVSPLGISQRIVLDGVDCVAISTETYCQMQTDIATLKQQLLCLSSLIQEAADSTSGDMAGGAASVFKYES